MERLSDNAIDIINELHTERLHYFSEYIPLIDAANLLAEYEDTGLTPQEIEQMKARMPLHQWAGESPDKMSIFGVTVSKIMELAEAEKQKIDYTEIAKKLWTYICIIDDEKGTYEELADAIGLSDDELPFCRRLER